MLSGPSLIYEECMSLSEEQIYAKIRSIKRYMARIKSEIERCEDKSVVIDPSDSVILSVEREYLAAAKKALEDKGYEYKKTRKDIASEIFVANIPSIEKITFSLGGYFGGYDICSIIFDGDKVVLSKSHSYSPEEASNIQPGVTKDDFLNLLNDLHIEEWKKKYDDPFTCDGTQWKLSFLYSHGQPSVEFWGSNKYPYNFDNLTSLFKLKTSYCWFR